MLLYGQRQTHVFFKRFTRKLWLWKTIISHENLKPYSIFLKIYLFCSDPIILQHLSVCRKCDFITITSSARILPNLYVTLFLTSYLMKNVKKTFISLRIIMIQLSGEATLISGKPFLAIFFHCKSRHFTLLLDIFLEHCKVFLTSIHLLNYYDLTDW